MTERAGVIGWPIKHSVSPAMHNAAFAALGLDWAYDLLPVRPGELGQAVPDLIEQGYRGFNVTVPHKLDAFEMAQSRSETAQAIGAANTLTVESGGGLRADNTDAPGFWRDLEACGVAEPPADVLLLGTGGGARAVAYALLEGGWRVRVLSREESRAEALARTLSAHRHIAPASRGQLSETMARVKLVVNCTPVGMWPEVNASPWPEGVPFPSHVTLYDLIYNPPRTRLMAQAEAVGARAIGGLGMLVQQGAMSFQLWTGQAPPLDVMRAAAEQALSEVSA